MSVFGRVNERAITWDKLWGAGTDYPTPTIAGRNVSEITAMKYSVVWAAVGLIVDAVSFLTPEAYREDATGKITKEPVPSWVLKPHPEIRRAQVWGQILTSALMWGNGYGLMVHRDSDGMPIGVIPLDPADVYCEWNLEKPGYLRYRIGNPQQYPNVQFDRWLTSGDILHIAGPTLPGQPTGLSVIAQARESIGLGLTLEEFGARYFAQGSVAKVVLKTKKTLTEPQAREMVNTYERFHKGAGNWHRPAVLSGDAEIENISVPPDDAQFLQSREFQAVDVARWFRVPPHRVGIISKATSWGSGLAEENTALVLNTYRPWIKRFENAFTYYTPGGEDRGLQIHLADDELLRGSFKELVEAWGTAVEKKLATPNEGRKAMNLPPLPGGDKLVTTPPPVAPAPAPTMVKPDGPAKPVADKQNPLPGKPPLPAKPVAPQRDSADMEPPPFVLTPNTLARGR